jgi:glycosyltransferase involved in cell wall biosynthesis
VSREKVSVCMATYNGEKYIAEQVTSILEQLNLEDEIIISDDNSTDRTIQILKEINDSRIKIFYNPNEAGHTNNFQNAIQLASGEFLFLSDQDDVWCNDKLSRMLELLREYDFVVSDAKIVDAQLSPTGTTYFKIRGGGQNGFINNLIKAKYLGCCMAFQKKLLKKILPFPSNTCLCPHDLWISLIAECYYTTYVINEPLILYRRHGENVSTGGEKSLNSILYKIKFRSYSLIKVAFRFIV